MTLQYLSIVKLLIAVAFGFCYGLGGMFRKWIRRFVAPLCIYLPALLWLSISNDRYSHWLLLSPLLVCGFTHLGYSDNDGYGWIKRLYIGLGFGLAALPLAFVSGDWILFGLHIVLCTNAMYLLGTFNPMRNARDEETFLGFTFVALPIFMA